MRAWSHSLRGSVVVAVIVVITVLLGSILMVQAAALGTIGNTSRALELARENSAMLTRLRDATTEAAQAIYGVSASPSHNAFDQEISSVVNALPLGSATLLSISATSPSGSPIIFPDWRGVPATLSAPSSELVSTCSPTLLRLIGSRVAESAPFSVDFNFSRPTFATDENYRVRIEGELVSVPLSRFGLTLYDLPDEIGLATGTATWPTNIDPAQIAPRGLVPRRDPADIGELHTANLRPAHYRGLAALSETYGYIFSSAYLRRCSDFAGVTHFVQVGAGPANPTLDGVTQTSQTVTIDVAQLGWGTLGSFRDTKNLLVVVGMTSGSRVVLTDSGGSSAAVMLVLAGPSDRTLPPLEVDLAATITRPTVVVGYHVGVVSTAALQFDGALILDRDSTVQAPANSISVGHVSCWGGGLIDPNVFQLRSMSAAAEALIPRVTYVAAKKEFL